MVLKEIRNLVRMWRNSDEESKEREKHVFGEPICAHMAGTDIRFLLWNEYKKSYWISDTILSNIQFNEEKLIFYVYMPRYRNCFKA